MFLSMLLLSVDLRESTPKTKSRLARPFLDTSSNKPLPPGFMEAVTVIARAEACQPCRVDVPWILTDTFEAFKVRASVPPAHEVVGRESRGPRRAAIKTVEPNACLMIFSPSLKGQGGAQTGHRYEGIM